MNQNLIKIIIFLSSLIALNALAENNDNIQAQIGDCSTVIEHEDGSVTRSGNCKDEKKLDMSRTESTVTKAKDIATNATNDVKSQKQKK